MRWGKTEKEICDVRNAWRPWFAWHPVRIEEESTKYHTTGCIVWLEWVLRWQGRDWLNRGFGGKAYREYKYQSFWHGD